MEKMPYCVRDAGDGYYLILNREYNSVYILYDDCPIYFKLKELTPVDASRISYKGDPDMTAIYLYDDDSDPTLNVWNMREYLERVDLLKKLYQDEL